MKNYKLPVSFWVFAVAGLLASAGCNSSSSSGLVFFGAWDVRYNLAIDDCQLVTPGIIGFADEHQITLENENYSLSATSGIGGGATGSVSDNTLTMIQEDSGDIFGDGSFCIQTVTVGYSDLTNDDATTTFRFSLECNDGFLCGSEGLGQATRLLSIASSDTATSGEH